MHIRLPLIPAIAAAVIAWAAPVDADTMVDLHAADVRVHDQTAATRASALKDALSQVLVKVTGSQAVLETDEAKQLLANPARFLQQFRYEPVQPVPVDPEAARLVLHAEFDGGAIEQRLRAAGLPLWGRERPLTLVWLAFSDGAERRLAGGPPENADPLADALRRAADRRGLPLVLPALDAEDAMRVNFLDVWGVYEEPLLAAAGRYTPDAVLVGSVFSAGSELWAGRWTLLRDGQRERWEASGASPEAVATAAVDALAERYAREFAVVTGAAGETTVRVDVTNVRQLQDYADVQSYLSGLSVVKHTGLEEVENDRVRFELVLNGSVQSLRQAVALGRTLTPVADEVVVPLMPPPSRSTGEAEGEAADTPLFAPPAPQPPLLRYRYEARAR